MKGAKNKIRRSRKTTVQNCGTLQKTLDAPVTAHQVKKLRRGVELPLRGSDVMGGVYLGGDVKLSERAKKIIRKGVRVEARIKKRGKSELDITADIYGR